MMGMVLPGPTLRLGQAMFGMARWAGISHSGFGHNAINFRGTTPRLRFDTMLDRATAIQIQSIGLRRTAKP